MDCFCKDQSIVRKMIYVMRSYKNSAFLFIVVSDRLFETFYQSRDRDRLMGLSAFLKGRLYQSSHYDVNTKLRENTNR